jgi:hypothetical protein
MPFWASRFPQEEKIESVRIKYFIAIATELEYFLLNISCCPQGLAMPGKSLN